MHTRFSVLTEVELTLESSLPLNTQLPNTMLVAAQLPETCPLVVVFQLPLTPPAPMPAVKVSSWLLPLETATPTLATIRRPLPPMSSVLLPLIPLKPAVARSTLALTSVTLVIAPACVHLEVIFPEHGICPILPPEPSVEHLWLVPMFVVELLFTLPKTLTPNSPKYLLL